MSHILVTGANGYVGGALVSELLATTGHTLTLLDHRFDAPAPPGARQVLGSLTDHAALDEALRDRPDTVFHLASVPGALAEREYQLGFEVNLQATLALAHRLADQGRESGRAARLVFASSVAVYGDLGSGGAHEHQPALPALSYGAHKLMAEIALADLSRRGAIDAVSLRLPGIVARPPAESGHGSAFMSLVMRRLAAGEPYVCPVPPHATAWWMSLPCCVANLLHAAAMSTAAAPASRAWQLPVLTLSVDGIVDALARRYGPRCRELVSHQPDERITALFGRMPPLHTPAALAAGFRHDGDADQLIQAALK
ncbi:NAD-dependent epimerase/dehydratase family protein [Pseudoduganella namucuonensis]|uniref:Nucleoside-diphosphate-sugar epimerase n=1 Tax=Pseudoduganella namucuonensis TaxID=1035707 RepID=A0A1I7LHS3_9BURK|nr:NAD-dependent epimerase/dehydratase family protein [Pseudoduganella namucuonensis]SFV09225.1 Nucleoside-diphosphate-sugar epimerase [Pseudoduganella namucuonensis]